ncbi:hypothetical protein BN2475_50010 [Paraburkholderia ribeironis]|uniref:Uncharacterized protein n=1 Tax=Paraburkholderia ribeironis TaxID=1247936 RepID=A0A1N7RJW8_9BURK|nr:hypothetical protein BN2475_50010 [Paraburkholderia ribeironis]
MSVFLNSDESGSANVHKSINVKESTKNLFEYFKYRAETENIISECEFAELPLREFTLKIHPTIKIRLPCSDAFAARAARPCVTRVSRGIRGSHARQREQPAPRSRAD